MSVLTALSAAVSVGVGLVFKSLMILSATVSSCVEQSMSVLTALSAPVSVGVMRDV
jgi:hypothetical protein